MARSSKPAQVDADSVPVDASYDPTPVIEGADTWEWDTVAKESPISVIFENIGDEFIGLFTGRETITPPKDEPFVVLTFEDSRGKRYSISPTYKLDRAFADEEALRGKWCRILMTALIPTGNKEPMKDFRVDVKR